MTDEELQNISLLTEAIGIDFIEVYGKYTTKIPKILILLTMAGVLASCCAEAGVPRTRILDTLNSMFNDIENKNLRRQ